MMDDQSAAQPVARRAAEKKRRPNGLKALWMKIREPLAQSRIAKGCVTALLRRMGCASSG